MLRLLASAFAAVARASVRPPILPFGSLIGFGILIPIRHGLDFLDVRMVLAYAFIPMLFIAAPVATGITFARQSLPYLYAWIAGATAYGWCIGFTFLTTGIATVNFLYHPTPLQLPEPGVLPLFAAFSFAAVWFISAASAFLAILFHPAASRTAMRLGFLILLLMFYVGPQSLPDTIQFELTQIDLRDGVMAAAAILCLAAAGMTNALRGAVTMPAPPASPTVAEPS